MRSPKKTTKISLFDCPNCDGSGMIWSYINGKYCTEDCPFCGGEGELTEEELDEYETFPF